MREHHEKKSKNKMDEREERNKKEYNFGGEKRKISIIEKREKKY